MAGEMSDLDLLDKAATDIRAGYQLSPEQSELLASILDAECALRESLEPFVELLNLSFEQAGGGSAALKLMRHDESGEIQVVADNTSNSVRLARSIIDNKES